MRLVISPMAEKDLEEIGDYIAQNNPLRAQYFVEELYEQCRQMGDFPQAYRKRPELGERRRSRAYGRYVIIFSENQNEVRIERILHGARDINELLTD